MPLIFRLIKGTPLTFLEGDNNLRYLEGLAVSSSNNFNNWTGSALSQFAGTASLALTASYALNAGTTINTGSLVTTASFNAFTASYNTGSFSGSFTGSLYGTASWAENATTALFATNYLFTSSVLEYYVDKKFTGGCGVIIDSNRSITSTNPNYLIQLSASKIGNPNYPYPDLWSAAFAASQSISSGYITSARIIVKTGNEYTYGSSVLTQNGDLTGSLTNNIQPDVAISQSDYNSQAFNLLSPNIEFYFEPETALYNINKSWQQVLVYYTSSNWNITPEFKITGKGKFVHVYGQGQGFISQFGIIAAPRANIILEADHIIQNMYQGWILTGETVNVNVNKWWSYSGIMLAANYYGEYSSAIPHSRIPVFNYMSQSVAFPSASILPSVNINIDEIKWGQFDFGIAPHFADYWAGIAVGYPYGSVYNINVNNLYIKSNCVDPFYVVNTVAPSSISDPLSPNFRVGYNNVVKINTNYVSASKGSNHPSGGGRAQFVGGHLYNFCRARYTTTPYGLTENIYIHAHINKMDSWGIGAGSGHETSNLSKSTIIFSCDDYTLYDRLGPFTGFSGNTQADACVAIRLANYTSSSIGAITGSLINNNIVFKGTYKNYSTASNIGSITMGGIGAQDNLLYTDVMFDNFNSYQMNAVAAASSSILFGNVFLANGYPTSSYVVMKDCLFYTSGSDFVRNATSKPVNIITSNVLTNRDFPSSINLDGDLTISQNLNRLVY